MSWEKLRGDGLGFWKIVEHLNEYNEGGIEEGWDALKGYHGISSANKKRLSQKLMLLANS